MEETLLKNLPSVDEVLKSPQGQHWLARYPRRFVLEAIRLRIAELRAEIRRGGKPALGPESISPAIEAGIKKLATPSLRPVINATGIVLHTNLGRAPLPAAAIERIVEVSKGYSNLEYNLREGRRGKRHSHIKRLLTDITGAESATVVNNNAAAVLLALGTLARGREVIVSRGELVEIGGSFRIPDVMEQSGAVLKEVGTTNKTHLKDYEKAISTETALILKVHQSNYRMIGFTEDVPIEELVLLGKKYSIPVMYDLGSGSFVDFGQLGIKGEPAVRDVVSKGPDVVTFSGDKLLGGPQAGIILGGEEQIEAINKNPLARALRIDKLTLAALEVVLFIYAGDVPGGIPAVRMLLEEPRSIKVRAQKLAGGLEKLSGLKVALVEEASEAGGGSLPGVSLKSYAVSISPEDIGVNGLEERLRLGEPPVIARIKEDKLLLDARTIDPGQIKAVIECVKGAIAPPDKTPKAALPNPSE
jgi:L-seryl-tRNA(Ser) seleniumtransferase